MHSHTEILSLALSEIERLELPLLRWGVVGGILGENEVLEALESHFPKDSIGEIVDELLQRRVLLEVLSSADEFIGYRTRMAESIRLMRMLKQTRRNQQSWQGRDLVADFYLIHRPRSRPSRNKPKQDLVGLISSLVGPSGQKMLDRVLPSTVSAFQIRSAQALLRGVHSSTSQGVMISAGTGAGKTLAFYGPALAHICEIRSGPPGKRGVEMLSIYPRNELLKDQLRTLLKLTLRIYDETGIVIRVGCWFGGVPQTSEAVISDERGWKLRPSLNGRVCPFMKCLNDGCKSELIWLETDRSTKVERLVCSSEHCEFEIAGEFLTITRDRAQSDPPDVMLTSTESLNRQLANTRARRAFGIESDHTPSFILLDEIHTYEGISGAQSAILMRRLRALLPQNHPTVFVGLSATLEESKEFLAEFVNLDPSEVELVEPIRGDTSSSEFEEVGAEYLVALRHDPSELTGVLSTTIQLSMLTTRILDVTDDNYDREKKPSSEGMFGKKTFVFTDKLDVTNRLFWDLLDAEGWRGAKTPSTDRPRSLAHLRSQSQDGLPQRLQETPYTRDADGQWWWLSEEIGHELDDPNAQVRIARTSSQDPGVLDAANVVIATASLEVGYDDDTVGAVIQHKAPHDAARFIQRRGRAGRDMDMRPWSLVALSNWGRDRRAWETPEGLFDPVLRRKSLPIRNRHVLRMQSVYATLDWLARRVPRSSTWADLSGPAKELAAEDNLDQVERHRRRQQRIQSILRDVLLGGKSREELRNYLRRALGFDYSEESERELDAVLWSPPRSLLLAVIPTMLRRLETQWEGEEVDRNSPSVRNRTPLREFIAGNLFGDLMLPETEVVVPAPSLGVERVEYLPTVRTLRELMPGNVTSHFGDRFDSRRHWVPVHVDNIGVSRVEQTINVVDTYSGVLIGFVPSGEDEEHWIKVYRPMRVALELVDDDRLSDSTSITPSWGVHLTSIGDGDRLAFGSAEWQKIVPEITTHLAARGGGVRIVRYAKEASGVVYHARASSDYAVNFTNGDNSPDLVALGFEMEVDGIRLRVRVPDEWTPTDADRTDWLTDAFLESVRLPKDFNSFDRRNLVSAVIVVLGREGATVLDLPDSQLESHLARALENLQRVRRQRDEIWEGDPVVLRELRRIVKSVFDAPDSDWTIWHQRRVATAVASTIVSASGRFFAELDTDDLTIDFESDTPVNGELTIWITEQTPGGNGQVDLIDQALTEDPLLFRRLLQAELAVRSSEVGGRQISNVLSFLGESGEGRAAVQRLRESWTEGQGATTNSIERLHESLEINDIDCGREAWAIVTNRILAPGLSEEPLDLAIDLDVRRKALTERLPFVLTSIELAAVIYEEIEIEKFPSLQSAKTFGDGEVIRRLSRFTWPEDLVDNFDADGFGNFGSLPTADRGSLRKLVASEETEIYVDGNDLPVQQMCDLLSRVAEVNICFRADRRDLAKQMVLSAQQLLVEVGEQLLYPRTSGVEETSSGWLKVRFDVGYEI